MPRYSNNLNLPQAIVDAVTFETLYDGPKRSTEGTISVTQLTTPPQLRVLSKLYDDDITEDVSDRLWALYGQLVHHVLEERVKRRIANGETNVMVEKRLVAMYGGWQVSGRFDHVEVEKGELSDYKFVSVYAVQDGVKPDWEQQLNILATLIEDKGFGPVNTLRIIPMFRDWREGELARSKGGYPMSPMGSMPVKLWPRDERVAWIESRVKLHQKAEQGMPDPCTNEERWVKKGIPARCARYCQVRQWCSQAKEPPAPE